MESLQSAELQTTCIEALDQARDKILELEAACDSWTPYRSKNPIIQASKKKSPSGLNIMRADCLIAASIDEVAKVASYMDEDKKWDPVLETTMEVAVFPDFKIVRNTYWAPFPVSRRDFVLAERLYRYQEQIVDVCVSIDTALAPEVKGFVRGQIHYGGFILKALSSHVTEAVHIVYADPKGRLPKLLVNLGQKKHYQYLERLKTYIETLVRD